ncbi:uncharacterized protein PV09_03646 [Verruconis gallopava]|uniref:Translation initiation factor eIF2B subunit beta n=1 Tax=Verruconis gallopava TaxID=253628 RepID=A0A0D1YWM6_9PEZI|nr:uncharacterized protein PV09_03646 [Verruconis gallopava]KIW05087.1 hypothetical protein PV09_03646 [Verruconis gallopava]
MPAVTVTITPGLPSFLKSLKGRDVESSIEQLISLLKRRQICNSRSCAIATAELLRRVVADYRGRDAAGLIERIRAVGNRLVNAQPREMVVGNIIRRVLGLIREIIDQKEGQDDIASDADSPERQEASKRSKLLPSNMSTLSPLKHSVIHPVESTGDDEGTATPASDASSARRPPLLTSHTSFAPSGAPTVTSLFGLFSQPGSSIASTPPNFANSPTTRPIMFADKIFRYDTANGSQDHNIKADVIEGIREILDELDIVDEQISQYALENIHSDEIILTHTSSLTIQRFLLTAARKRKFTVIHVESYPNDSQTTHDVILHGSKKDVAAVDESEEEDRFKPLTAAGIKVIMIPDSAVFAIMSRVNKVILATHSVLANGGLVAAAGAKMIAQVAQAHQTPVVVLTGIYKLSPIYPFDVDELIEWGDAGQVASYESKEFVESVDVINPVFDYVPPELVDLYISNLGSHAPSYLYHVVAEHYDFRDINL